MLDYASALRLIFQRTNYERQERPPYAERYYRLDRVRELMAALGDPHQRYRSVHVTGTKGKGSTTAIIDAALRAAGYRTGMYTSPHLHTFRERIRLQGEPIAEAEVARLVEQIGPVLQARPEVTVFEIITALAMVYYAEQGVDIGVFEVGMGGRLDATNMLQPLVSVITAISMDHTKVLGDTIEAIAREKAGIIKPNTPVVSSPQRAGALGVIEETSARLESPLTLVGRDWWWQPLDADLHGQRFHVYRVGHQAAPEYPALQTPLLGEHQLENATAAIAALETLRTEGLLLTREQIRAGVASVIWPGRLEVLGERPLVVVDGAHNPHSCSRLIEAVTAYLPHARTWLVFGAGTTHNPHELLEILLPATDGSWMTHANHAKATPPDQLVEAAHSLGRAAHASETVSEALRQALDAAQPDDLVLVTGSLFVVAEARAAWTEIHSLPPLPADPEGVY
jgi:dihydrofolate synthase/folylpolyglutamate synthase